MAVQHGTGIRKQAVNLAMQQGLGAITLPWSSTSMTAKESRNPLWPPLRVIATRGPSMRTLILPAVAGTQPRASIRRPARMMSSWARTGIAGTT
jgi:hypothetical protein